MNGRTSFDQEVLAGVECAPVQGGLFDVAAVVEVPEITTGPARCPGCGIMLACRAGEPIWQMCGRCARLGVVADVLDIEPESEPEAPEPLTPRQEHRARCDGQLVANAFGFHGEMSRAYCDTCGYRD